MSRVPVHWEDAGWLPPSGGMQADGEADKEEDGWYIGTTPTGGGNVGGGNIGGGELLCSLPEHSRKIHFNQVHYGPVYGGRATPGEKGVNTGVGAGVPVPGGDVDGGMGERN